MKQLPLPPLPRGGRGKTVAAFAIGAAVGSALALLFAPASGKVTRKRLAQGVRRLQKTGIRKIGKATRAIALKVGNAREAAGEWFTQRVNGHGKHVARHHA